MAGMDQEWIYLDYNASTPMDEEVVAIMQECLTGQGHPSSSHPHGRKANSYITEARASVATAIGCRPEEIVFCSGATEASNHIIKGVCFKHLPRSEKLHFISSVVDHAATLEPLKFLQKLGHEVSLLPVDRFGMIDPQKVACEIRPNTALVTLIHGQNEVGSVQDLREIGRLCKEKKVLFHADCSQSFGKVPLDAGELSADFINIAGHKIYGPKGVGALFVRAGRELEPLLHGAGHESGMRSGTPATLLIAGLGKACELVTKGGLLPSFGTDLLWQLLSESLGEKVRRNGHPTQRLPNVLHVSFESIDGRELLESAKISASTGAACHSAAGSPVLKALGFTASEALGSVRLSVGRYSQEATLVRAAEALISSYQKITSKVKA